MVCISLKLLLADQQGNLSFVQAHIMMILAMFLVSEPSNIAIT